MFKYTEKWIKYYDEVIRLHTEEGYGCRKIAKIIPISHATASLWIANFVFEKGKPCHRTTDMNKKKKLTETVSDETSVLMARIAELERQLDYEKLRAMAYDKMIDLAEKRFNIQIRKKSDARQ
ncbi:MAG: transposase [Bacteroidales bacterium]|nr:transposase [Bacteroidales bacterium]